MRKSFRIFTRMQRSIAVSAAVAMFLQPGSVPPSQAQDAGAEVTAGLLREDLLAIADANLEIGTVLELDEVVTASEELRRVIEQLAPEDFTQFSEAANTIAYWRMNSDNLNAAVLLNAAAALRAGVLRRSSGLPGRSFNTVCPESHPASNSNAMLSVLTIKHVAELALAITEFICRQEANGFKVAAACVGVSIAAQVAQQVWANFSFCNNDHNGVFLDTALARQEHVHDDVSDVDDSLDTIQAAVTALANTLDNLKQRAAEVKSDLSQHRNNFVGRADTFDASIASIEADLTARTDAIDSTLGGHDTSAKGFVSSLQSTIAVMESTLDTRADSIGAKLALLEIASQSQSGDKTDVFNQLEIERVLAASSGGAVIQFHLPDTVGGLAELSHEITVNSVNRLEASGMQTNRARSFLAEGETALAIGNYEEAFLLFRKAYRDATRGFE